jgi:hypothetical protein
MCVGEGCLQILITLVSTPRSFPFRGIFQFQLVFLSCPLAPLLP